MTVNPRITPDYPGAPAVVEPPGGVKTPPVVAVVLVDGAGHVLAADDNGDGTATLRVNVSTLPAVDGGTP